MKLSVNKAQRILLLGSAAVLALVETHQILTHGNGGFRSLFAYVLATGLAFMGLRSRPGQATAQPGGPKDLPGGAAKANGGNGSNGGGPSVPSAQAEDFAQVEKYLSVTISASEKLNDLLVDRFSWDLGADDECSLPKQIFRESCTILAYYLVCLSLSGGANLALLRRIQNSLRHRTALYILRLDKRCSPETLADSELCKEKSAQGLALIDSFLHLFDLTVDNFLKKRPYPLNELIGGILMLFEGQISPEEDFWEAKYGDVVYAVLEDITRKRRTPA